MAETSPLFRLGIVYDRALTLRGIDGLLIAAQPVVAALVFGFSTNDGQFLTPQSCAGLLIVIVILRRSIIWPASRFLSTSAHRHGLALRRSTLEHLIVLPLGRFRTIGGGRLIQAISEDILWLENHHAYTRPELVANAATLAVCLLGATIAWPLLGVVAMVTTATGFGILAAARGMLVSGFERRAASLAKIAQAMQEHADGIAVLRAFQGDWDDDGVFAINVGKLQEGAWRGVTAAAPVAILFRMTIELSAGLAILVGLLAQFRQGPFASTDAGTLVAAVVLIIAATVPARNFSSFAAMLVLARIGRQNIGSIFKLPVPGSGQNLPAPEHVEVRFDAVTLTHAGQETAALSHISFEAPQTTLTAVVGLNGSGKTTCLQMIMRFWDADRGSICIGGIDICDIERTALASTIAPVFQEALLFDDTIAGNLRVARADATDLEIEAAARLANIHDEIMRFEHGYETGVGPRGSRLSGGERQRLSIARAILRDAPIVILDEATASLDPENQEAIQAAITSLVRGRTVFVIAHDLARIANADQILMMEAGSLVGCGTHDELLLACPAYRRLCERSQASHGWRL